jgi:hypothetical protein
MQLYGSANVELSALSAATPVMQTGHEIVNQVSSTGRSTRGLGDITPRPVSYRRAYCKRKLSWSRLV